MPEPAAERPGTEPLVAQPPAFAAAHHEDILPAFAATLACAHAGRAEPVTRACRAGAVPLPDGGMAPSAVHAALVTATAGHPLDHDDVHPGSATHPSVVIVTALLAVQAASSLARHAATGAQVPAAFLAGPDRLRAPLVAAAA